MKYAVFNVTDGIPASREPFDTKEEAEQFKADFPKRYEHQGYYLNSNRERINPNEVELTIVEVEE